MNPKIALFYCRTLPSGPTGHQQEDRPGADLLGRGRGWVVALIRFSRSLRGLADALTALRACQAAGGGGRPPAQ